MDTNHITDSMTYMNPIEVPEEGRRAHLRVSQDFTVGVCRAHSHDMLFAWTAGANRRLRDARCAYCGAALRRTCLSNTFWDPKRHQLADREPLFGAQEVQS
jgi:hypothetical protein